MARMNYSKLARAIPGNVSYVAQVKQVPTKKEITGTMPTEQKSIGRKTLVEGPKVPNEDRSPKQGRPTRSKMVWIALATAAFVLVTGVSLILTRQGNSSEKETTPSTVATATNGNGPSSPTASGGAVDPKTQQMVDAVTSQLQQALTNGGQPKTMTPEEVEAMLRAQLQQLGVR